MPALGRGRLMRTHDVGFDGLLPRTDGLGSGVASSASRDFWYGFSPPTPTQIPYAWLSPPFRARADRPLNDQTVTRTGGATGYAPNAASIARFGSVSNPVTLETAVDADAQALANWQTTYYTNPRMRCPSLTVNLFGPSRSDPEKWRTLGVKIGTRIQITGAPATWPEGTTSLIVEGVTHQIGQGVRTVTWNTSPVIGATPGMVGPWFRLNGGSFIDGTDPVPF